MNPTSYRLSDLIRFRSRHPRATKIGNNTYLVGNGTDAQPFTIRLHSTDIVQVSADTIRFDTGGWETVTTKERMNRAMPNGCSLIQRQWRWYVKTPHTTIQVGDRFHMRLLADGTWNVVSPFCPV